ncbi:MAG: pyridoxamine 5'-phosphate oxidase family protein [Chloroflexi bacterium]|nr:pyridoxamine 5'-phosphate oxidase family protein [Chloroflexota bacterium]
MMDEKTRETFLAETRYACLTTQGSDGTPYTVPVWFEWDGTVVRFFTSISSPKIRRIRQNPRISLLMVNHLSEREAWVTFTGKATIHTAGGIALAERLAAKYWDLSDPNKRQTVESWRSAADNLCVVELVPDSIRTH